MPAPSLVVFDLDFTLWDCGGTWCDCLSPPFSSDSGGRGAGRVSDRFDRQVTLYPDVERILNWCDEGAIPMALASRTEQPSWARTLLDLLGISHRFEYAEIYPSSKVKHFTALADSTGLPLSEMLFFDDEQRNIQECSEMGVRCVHVSRGIHWELFLNHVSQT